MRDAGQPEVSLGVSMGLGVCEGLEIWGSSRQDVKRKCRLETEITRDVQTPIPAT